jgi:hypothetical protein
MSFNSLTSVLLANSQYRVLVGMLLRNPTLHPIAAGAQSFPIDSACDKY